MLNLRFSPACSPAPEEAVAAAERQLEVRIPSDYRQFLLDVCNGGRPEDNVFEQDEVSTGVVSFLGVGRDDDDMVKVYEVFKDRVPSWLLPVARAEAGNLFCVSIRPEDEGVVYFWDHELEAEEGEPPTEENLSSVADSFGAFASALRPTADEDMPQDMEVKRAWVDPAFLEKLNKGEAR